MLSQVLHVAHNQRFKRTESETCMKSGMTRTENELGEFQPEFEIPLLGVV